jgi:hypothetical protein
MNLPFTLPFTLPDWLPAWAFLLAALPVLLYALAFIIMPFSVFGVKARLEGLESQLDAIQEDLRHLMSRARAQSRGGYADDDDYDTLPQFNRLKSARASTAAPQAAPPPIPPAPISAGTDPREKYASPRLPQRPGRRTEPRLD